MRIRAIIGDDRWRYVATALDARLLLVCLACALFFAPFSALPLASRLDQALLVFGAMLQRETVNTHDYARVEIPAAEMQRLLHDPVSARSTMDFLAQLQQTFPRGVALVLREELWTQYSAAEFVLSNSHVLNAGLPQDAGVAMASITASFRTFLSLLADSRVVRAEVVSQPGEPHIEWSGLLTGQVLLPFFQLPPDNPVTGVPLADGLRPERPLLWQTGKDVRPDAALTLFQLKRQLRMPEWLPGQGVRLQDHLLLTSGNATALPFYALGRAGSPAIVRYKLAELSGQEARRILHEKTVIIAEEGDLAADNLLYTVLSLETGQYAVMSAWSIWLHIAVMTVVLVYALCLPYLRIKVGVVISLLLVLGLLLAQQIMLLLHREWIPVAQWLLFLVGAHVFMLLWCVRRSFYPVDAAAAAATVIAPTRVATPPGMRIPGFSIKAGKKPETKIAPVFGQSADDEDIGEDVLQGTMPINRPINRPATVASSGAPEKTRRQLGRYQVQRELGRGAMGVVYLGYDPKISRQVAIKTLHYNQFSTAELPALKERFFREAEAAGRLRHPNIVTIYDAGEENDLAYIAMDYVNGDSLASHVRKPDLLDIEMVYWIMAQVADAVDYANSQGIIHRDIKPSNILFDDQANEVKVADFGIARIMDGSATRTRTGDILGSPLYMSPEQLKGETVSGQSDIFSIGVTFYQLLTGELPFKGDSLANLSYQIVQGKYRPVDEVRSDLPDSAKRITAKALQKNPANRYAAAGEMAEALRRAYDREFC